MANYTRGEIALACRDYGGQVAPLPDGIEGAQLLWALSGNESSFGANCTPRHEPAYDIGGRYEGGNWALAKFGSESAFSYGPWQIMFVNCPRTYMPSDMNNLDMATIATVQFLSAQLNRFSPTSLEQIGAIWNGGNPYALSHPPVQAYAEKLVRNYAIPMEEL